MIYLDTSVALAALFDEARRPEPGFWEQPLVSSRLLEYELSLRLNARGVPLMHAGDILARVGLVELLPAVLERANRPFPTPVRTLDALHLATAHALRGHGQQVQLATYDAQMAHGARALGLPLYFSA